ncbi:hypothetical protein TNIN_297251 [Trichonephila inaurata madagascariensis]|uniref:Uncharacterized protein n=1 Tax=Trichonephila inaurata madagascariensis TaxID=2747483 RepID=A0A8X6WTP2_9ARAC|nr:hypothetical protein TNIN_297251 [Trichonephila inaurata madagascariensis]
MENGQTNSGSPPNRFKVITVGCENEAFESDEKLAVNSSGRPQHRLSVQDFLAVVVPGRRRSSSLNVPDSFESKSSL